ncbi:MAG: hypothetical protein ABL982_25340 [Vicinamibacterales bacterium]
MQRRKPDGERVVRWQVCADPAVASSIDAYASAQAISRSAAISRLLAAALAAEQEANTA